MQLVSKPNDQGTSIAQITHSGINGAFDLRTIELCDGWFTPSTSNPTLNTAIEIMA